MYVCMYVCIYVCMYICILIWMYVCLLEGYDVCMWVYVLLFIGLHAKSEERNSHIIIKRFHA